MIELRVAFAYFVFKVRLLVGLIVFGNALKDQRPFNPMASGHFAAMRGD